MCHPATGEGHQIGLSGECVGDAQLGCVGTDTSCCYRLRTRTLLHGMHLNIVDVPLESDVAHGDAQGYAAVGRRTVEGDCLCARHYIIADHIVGCIEGM